MAHGIGDFLNLLDISDTDKEVLKATYDRHPELAPDLRPIRTVKAENRRAFGFTVQLPAIALNGAGAMAGQPYRVLPMDPTRVKATIAVPPSSGAFTDFAGGAVPTFSGIVRLGQSSDLSSGGGFTLYPGQSRDVESSDDLYAIASAPVALSVWVESDPEE